MNMLTRASDLFYKILVLFICALSLWITRNTTIDDSFISWRQGFNMLNHGRFTFNPSGENSNGATSTLFGLISILPNFFGIDTVLFFKAISLITILGFVLLASKVTTSRNRFTFLLLSLGTLTFGIHLWGGLETSISVLLSTLLIVYSRTSFNNAKLFLYYSCAFALVWIRMDLIFFTIAIAMAQILSLELNSSKDSQFLLRIAKSVYFNILIRVSALSLALQLIFLRVFSGNYLPTSILRKSFSNSDPVSHAITNSYSLLVWIGIAAIAISFCKNSADKSFLIVLALSVFFSLGVIYLLSDLQMNFAGRFGYMLTWPIVLASVFFAAKIDLLQPIKYLAIWVLISVNLPYVEASQLVTFYERLQNAQGRIGLSASMESSKTYIVAGDAGIISYMAPNAIFQDTNGLVTTKPSVESLNQDTSDGSLPLIVVLVTPTPELSNFMPNQQFLVEWINDQELIHLGSMQWDAGYYNQIWVSQALGKKRIDSLKLQVIYSRNQQTSSKSLKFKSDQSFNWLLPKKP